MAHNRASVTLAAIAAALTPLIPSLPDGDVGSPRSLVTGLVAGLLAAAVVVRGAEETHGTP